MADEQNPAKQVILTLVGITVVIVILGLSATLLVPNVIGRPDEEANVNKARADVASLSDTVELYALQNRNQDLPTWSTLITPDERGTVWLEGYSEPPQDPWGNEYQLLSLPTEHVLGEGPTGVRQ